MTAPGETGIRVSLPPHAHLTEETTEYVITLDVSDFTEREVSVDVIARRVVVRGEQTRVAEKELPFAIDEHLEESFLLPDDAEPSQVTASYSHGTLCIRVPRRGADHPHLRVSAHAEPV